MRHAVLDYVDGVYESDPARIERSVHSALAKLGLWRSRAAAAARGATAERCAVPMHDPCCPPGRLDCWGFQSWIAMQFNTRDEREARRESTHGATTRGACGPVHFRGVVLGQSGFAAEGREWLWALDAGGQQPSLDGARLGPHELRLDDADLALLRRCTARRRAPGGTVFHHLLIPHFAPDPTAASNVLSAIFETEGLPPGWAEHAGRADLVLVRTEWSRAAFARAGVAAARLRVVPPPFDARWFTPRPVLPRPGRPLRLLSVFDWSLRKGYDVLLAAFGRAFTAGEAELLLKVTPHRARSRESLQAECSERVRATARGQPALVHVDDRILDTAALVELYASVDAFVLPSRGEGWGRPVHEAMLMQLPVVTTRATALATLVPDDRFGFPVEATAVPVSDAAAVETPCYRGQIWWEPNLAHLVERLRELAADLDAARARGRAARGRVLELCDRTRIARALTALDVLQQRA